MQKQTCVGQAMQACSWQMVNLMKTLGLLLQNEARRIHCDPQTKSPQSNMNMLASLVRRMFAFVYGENEFMLLQMKGLVWGTGQALLRSPRGRNASRDGLVKLGWIHCLQYTLNCFQYNVCGLCRCEPSNHQLTLHNVI